MKRWVLSVALCAVVSNACTPNIPTTAAGTFIVARFDPSAVPPVLPTPNDLATNATTGFLAVPIPATAAGADRAFYEWLNTLNGFPPAASATATFNRELDGATVGAATVKVFDLSAANAVVTTTIAYADSGNLAGPGVLTVSAPMGGWAAGHRYAVAVIGGANGVKGRDGTRVVGSPTWAFIRSEKPLVTCEDLTTDCRPTTEIIPSDIKDDPARRLAAQTASAVQLEQLRRKYKPAVDSVLSQGVSRADLALLWTFKINDAPSVLFDPARSRLPTPNDRAISNGVVMTPIDLTSSPANQEVTRDYLNTLNGFPPSVAAAAGIVGEALDPTTVSSRTVRVAVISGPPLSAPPTISYNATLKQISVVPAGGSWGKGRTISATVIGGANGVKSVTGKPVVGSDAWALVRSAAPLVDCATLSPSCKSVVTAAPITNEQAVGLESLRRGYAPILDALADEEGVSRAEVAAIWVWSTVDQPEFLFDPVASPPRTPTPSNLALSNGKVAAPVPAGASEAYAELITEYLNTLNGFPVASTAVAELAGEVNATTINANTVRVLVVQGGALTGAPIISWDAGGKRIVVQPTGDSWGKGKTIAVAVLSGPTGVKDVNGRNLVASPTWAFARLANTLVDCETLGPGCKSVVSLSDAQAIAVEGLRRGFKPVVDAFVAQGITRRDLAGLWVFSTVNQPELTFELSSSVIVPFPSNQFLRSADDVDPAQTLTFSSSLGALAAGLNTLNGFSLTAPLVSENSQTATALDVGHLEATSLTDGGTGFAKLSGGGALSPNVQTCLGCASSDAGVPEQLQWVPRAPLEELTRYGAWVTTEVTDTNGRKVMASPTYALVRLRSPLIDAAQASTVPGLSTAQARQLEPIRLRFKECLDQLEARGTPRSKLALGFCMTTQSTLSTLRALTAGLNASALPTAPTLFVDTTVTVRAALSAASIPSSNVGAFIEGDVALPSVETLDPRRSRFLLTIPATPATSSAGYPVVIFGHGFGRSRRDLLLLADTFAASNLASIAIDAVFHGDRASCAGDASCADPLTMRCEVAGALAGRCVSRSAGAACDPSGTGDSVCFLAGQGRCIGSGAVGSCEGGAFRVEAPLEHVVTSGDGFLDPADLFATRDHLRHAGALDFAQLLRVLRSTAAGNLNSRLAGASLGGLSAAEVSYTGQSLGGFDGVLFAAATPGVNRFALNVAGADPVDLWLRAPAFSTQRAALLASLAAQGIHAGTPAFDQFVTLARTILDPADPQNAIFAAVNSSNLSRRVFVQYIEGDPVVPNAVTRTLLAAGRQNMSRQPSWFQFIEASTAAPGVIPANMSRDERHAFLLLPPTTAECSPLTALCATATARLQLTQFLTTGITPANTPVTP